jgi:methyl-accepting chemotaxis protein
MRTNFNNWSVTTKIMTLCIMLVVMILVGVFGYVLPVTYQQLKVEKQLASRHLVETVFQLITEYNARVVSGEFTLEEAQKRAMKRIENMRYGANEYFWINDTTPTMLMHPLKPEMNGKNLADVTDSNGKKFFVAFVDVGKEKGEGSVDYVWDKGGKPTPKISYVKLYKPWGWIVGTGVYVDDIQQAIASIRWKILAGTLLLLILVSALAFFISRSIMRQLGAEPKEVGEVANLVAVGDLSREITLKPGDTTSVMSAMKKMVDAIKVLVADANMLSEAAVAGRLATRADASKHQGDFQRIVAGVNDTLDAVIGPLNVAAEYVDRISKGDIPPRITDSYNGDFNEIKNNLNQCIDAVNALAADANMLADAAVAGRLATRADASTHRGDFRKIVEGVNDTIDRLVGFLDGMPAPAMIIDKEFSILYMNEMGAKVGGKTPQQLLGVKCYDHFKTSDCRTERCACAMAITHGQVSASETDAHPMAGLDLDISYTGVPIKDRQGAITGAFEVVTDQTAVKKAARVAGKQAKYQEEEVAKLLVNLEKMAIGDLNLTTTVAAGDEDTQAIAQNFEKIDTAIKQNIAALNTITSVSEQIALGDLAVEVRMRSTQDQLMKALAEMVAQLKSLAETAEKIADGDLTVTVKPASDKDLMGNAFSTMVGNLREIVGNVGASADSIASSSRQIATGNADMAQRSEEQASSLEETAASMEELTSTVKQNADNAQQANQLAIDASDVAVKGGNVIDKVVTTMDSISASSKKIADIIGVIDGIAFQTNILALNAAVEAARAGEQGRGFAVVAGEVRNLAQRSAAAAKEIKSLISDSVDKVNDGGKLVADAGQTMQEIVTSIKRVTDIMAEISAASVEQSGGIEQVNTAITQMDEITQQNSSVVQESAAAAEALEEQAQVLVAAVNRFKLDEAHRARMGETAEHKAVSRPPASIRPDKLIRQPGKAAKANGYHKTGKASGYHKDDIGEEAQPVTARAVGHDADWNEF